LESERRQFYRIDHPVALEFTIIPEPEHLDSLQPSHFKVSPYFMLQSQLHELDQEANAKLHQLGRSMPILTSYLQLMSKKIDLIAQTLSANQQMGDEIKTEIVNLSEGGLSFHNLQPIELNSLMAVKLVFPEGEMGLLLYARVQRCSPLSDGADIGIEFLKMPESCRIQLARLILETQARERKLYLND